MFYSRLLSDTTPCFVRLSVSQLVCHALLLSCLGGLSSHCSRPNALVTSSAGPAHPHATGVAVYPTFLLQNSVAWSSGTADQRATPRILRSSSLLPVFSRGHGTLHLAVSVGMSVCPSHFRNLSCFRINAPAQPSATRLPCIRPCLNGHVHSVLKDMFILF